MKQLCGKEIFLVKVVWGGSADGSITWELERQMRELYLTLFLSGDFLGRKLFKWGRVVTPYFFNLIILIESVCIYFYKINFYVH